MLNDERNLRIRPHLSVIVHGPDDIELRSGVWNPVSFTLRDGAKEGKLARIVTQLSEPTSTPAAAAAAKVSREEVERVVDHLGELGMIEHGPSTALDAYLATVATWRTDAAADPNQRVTLLMDGELGRGLASVVAGVIGDERVIEVPAGDPVRQVLDDPDASWLMDGLATEERLAVFESWQGAVVVAPKRVMNPAWYTVLNRASQRHGFRWIHGGLDGPFVLIGPTFIPNESACYECLETRVFLNLREGASYQRYKAALASAEVRHGAPPLLGPLDGLLTSYLAIETLNLLATGTTFTVGRLLAIHLPTLEHSMPDVLRVPGCKGCGSVPERDAEVFYFDPPLRPGAGR